MLRRLRGNPEINLAKKLEKKMEELKTLTASAGTTADGKTLVEWSPAKNKKLDNILRDIRELVGPAQEAAFIQSEVDSIRTAMEKTQYSRAELKKEMDKLKVDITGLEGKYAAALAQSQDAKATVGKAESRNYPGQAEAIQKDQSALDSGPETIRHYTEQNYRVPLSQKKAEYARQTEKQIAGISSLITALKKETQKIRATHSSVKEFKSAKEKSPIDLAKQLEDQAKELEAFLNSDKKSKKKAASIDIILSSIDQLKAPLESSLDKSIENLPHNEAFVGIKDAFVLGSESQDAKHHRLQMLSNVKNLKRADPDNASLMSDVVDLREKHVSIVNIRNSIAITKGLKASLQEEIALYTADLKKLEGEIKGMVEKNRNAGRLELSYDAKEKVKQITDVTRELREKKEQYAQETNNERQQISALVGALKAEATHIRKMEGSKTLMSVQEFKSTTEEVLLSAADRKTITDNLSALSQKSHSRVSFFGKSVPPKDPKKNLDALQECLRKYDGSESPGITKLKSQVSYAIVKYNADHKPASELQRSGPSLRG